MIASALADDRSRRGGVIVDGA